MSSVAIILFSSLLVFIFIGVPIAYSLGLSTLIAILFKGSIPLMVMPQRLFASADSFPLLAVPFFILAGELMQYGGISKRLVDFANELLGWITGSLAHVSIAACAFFAAISGSSAATTAAIGGIMYPEMKKRGYPDDFAAAIQAVGGTLGVVIPPSIPFVIYGTITGASVGDLFLSGIIPGLIAAIAYMLLSYIYVKRHGITSTTHKTSLHKLLISFSQAIWGLLMPGIILGGIYGGIFTPTEAAVVAVVYSLFVGTFVYRELNIKNMQKMFLNAGLTSAMVMTLITMASLFGWVMTIENIPQTTASAILSVANNKWVFLLLVNIVYLVSGMFLDTTAIILLLVPIFFPIASQLGINLVHFGMITVFNLAVGQITPPFGVCLFVASGVSGISLEKLTKQILPYLGLAIILILLFTYIPDISLLLVQ